MPHAPENPSRAPNSHIRDEERVRQHAPFTKYMAGCVTQPELTPSAPHYTLLILADHLERCCRRGVLAVRRDAIRKDRCGSSSTSKPSVRVIIPSSQ